MTSAAPHKLLILCWGYSIHARRRAQLFIDDPRFDVTVVSTFDYAFEGADNVLLGAGKKPVAQGETNVADGKSLLSLIPAPIRASLRRVLNLLMIGPELLGMRRDLATLRSVVARKQPDVVLLQTLQYPSFLAYCLQKDLPMAVTFWNGDLTYFAKWTGLEMLLKKHMVVHGLKRMNAITVNSQTAYDAGVVLGADPKKMTLLRYPGADLERFQPRSKLEARKRLGIKARYVLLCPRGLGDFFNSDVIVKAAAKIAERYSDILILFISGVGGEEEWTRHLQMAERLGVASSMRWDGQIVWEDMPWYYAAADVMVSIKTADSCPNCMLESMACGIPVIMSDTQQNREWIDDGRNGFMCPPRDAEVIADRIERLLMNRDEMVSEFTRICLEKVRKDANSNINVTRIKKLVADLASRGRP
jgi:glycosyltransferase involved in cell wall biosynthesis